MTARRRHRLQSANDVRDDSARRRRSSAVGTARARNADSLDRSSPRSFASRRASLVFENARSIDGECLIASAEKSAAQPEIRLLIRREDD